METTRYPTKVAWWGWLTLALVLASAPVCAYFGAVAEDPTEMWVLYGIAAFDLLFFVGILWPVAYILEPERMVIRIGLIRSGVPYAEIKGAELSRSPLSSPAYSMDRLKIDYRESKWVLISPPDREAFMKDLASRDEGLEYSPGRIQRR